MPDVFAALADPTRRLVLDELAHRDGQTLFELCARLVSKHGLGSTRQAISQHIAVLEDVGLVATQKRGRCKFHYLETRPLRGAFDRWLAVDKRDRRKRMRITMTSVFVDDQDKALAFYTGVLGFEKKSEIPLGDHRWLTVVSKSDPDGVQLVLEPDGHPAVKPFKEALAVDGIPFTSFAVDDVTAEFERLRARGVSFTQEPVQMGPVTTAVFDDTCGNLIQIAHRG